MPQVFAEVNIALNESDNGIIFFVKWKSRIFRFPVVMFPANAREGIAANARMFFNGLDMDASVIQNPLTVLTAKVTEWLLEAKINAIRLDIDDKLQNLPWELTLIERHNSTWGKYFRAVRLAKECKPNPHQIGETWRVFYMPEIMNQDGLAYYQALGCGRDEVDINDTGVNDALVKTLAENNLLHIAAHGEPENDYLTLLNNDGIFLKSQPPQPHISPRMIILDCCYSAQTPLFSFRSFFRNGCMVFVGHIGKMRVDNGYGSRFTKLWMKSMQDGHNLADCMKAGRDSDNLRDYSSVVYVWEGVQPHFCKKDVFGYIEMKPKENNRIKHVALTVSVIACILTLYLIIGYLLPNQHTNDNSNDHQKELIQNTEQPFTPITTDMSDSEPAVTLTPATHTDTEASVPPPTIEPTPTQATVTTAPTPVTDQPTAKPAPSFAEATYTNGAHVTGRVLNTSPNDYIVVLMILVGEGEQAQFYVKPDGKSYGTLSDTGAFDLPAFSDNGTDKAADLTASMYSLFLVPSSFDWSTMSDSTDYETVKNHAVVSLEYQQIIRTDSDHQANTAVPPQTESPNTTDQVAYAFRNVTYKDGIITGYAEGVPADEYAVVVMILAGDQYYVKPYFDASMLNAINAENHYFEITAYSSDANKDNDLLTTQFSLFVVPRTFDVKTMVHAVDYQALADAAVLKLEHEVINR